MQVLVSDIYIQYVHNTHFKVSMLHRSADSRKNDGSAFNQGVNMLKLTIIKDDVEGTES